MEKAMLARSILSGGLAFCCTIVIAASAVAETAQAPAAAAAAGPGTAGNPLAFDDAVLKAANELFSNAALPADADATYEVVIDPLIDGRSGAQTRATQSTEARIVALVQEKYPRFRVEPFSVAALDRKPLLMIGALTFTNNAGKAGAGGAYNIWFKLADLKTNAVVSMGHAFATTAGVDGTPTPSFGDSPAWTNDPAVRAYVKSCQGAKPGEMLDQAYVDQLRAAALIREGTAAYDAGRYEEALDRYSQALKTPGGNQLRVYNGLYLANWKLGHKAEAAAAFDRIVDYGLSHDRLGVKFLFQVGSVEFLDNSELTAPYAMWLDQIADRAAENRSCLRLVGHSSRSGAEQFNDELSIRRADRIRELLAAASPALASGLSSTGVGWRETIVGTGADNASDALDRRVEFKIAEAC
jgi:outer membrane protein OmpA-like peptidoglycan-associated protein